MSVAGSDVGAGSDAARPQATALVIRGLAFDHPGRPLFAGCDLCFRTGTTWLRGANGRGKSTLLKLLAGALRPAHGELRLGTIVEALDPLGWRREVHWIGPEAPVTGHLRPREYFAFMRGLYPRFDDVALARHVAGFGLDAAVLGRPIDRLSDGLRRKVALAAGLAAATRALLLDEPLDALDAGGQSHLRTVLGDVGEVGARVVIVASHVPPLSEGTPAPPVVDLDAIVDR